MIYLVNLNLSGNELQNVVIQPVGVLPGSAKEGQIVYNSSEKNLYIYNGSTWKVVGKEYTLPVASTSTLGGIKVGAGLAISEGVLSATGGGVADAVDWSNVQNKPEGLVIDESYVHTDNNYTGEEKTKLSGIQNGAEANVQADWNESSSSSDAYIKNKPTIPSTATEVGAIPTSEKGSNNGVATLDGSGKVPVAQLPSYVDDVVEYDNKTAFPQTGEDGKIYIAKDTNLTYRWSGTEYIEISPSLALGETSSTAYPGDKGKIAYDHSQVKTGNPHNTKFSDLPDKPKLVKIQEDTLPTTVSTKTVTIAGGKIFSTMVYDSVTFEEVIVDKKYDATRANVTITTATNPTNALTIVVSYIEI